jgi:hypothetical protein
VTTPTTTHQTDQTLVDSERGLLIAVLILVVLGAAAVVLMMS